jgi:hypothetical protein
MGIGMGQGTKSEWDEPETSQVAAVAADELSRSPYWELRHIDCAIHGQKLVLTGQVTSSYYKQLAQSCLQRRLCESFTLDNRLRVTE